MESKGLLLCRPAHPRAVIFLLRMAIILDTIRFDTSQVRWTEVAFYIITAGVVISLLSAIPVWWLLPIREALDRTN